MEYVASGQAARDDKLKQAKKGLTAEALTKAGWKEEDIKRFKVGKHRVTGKNKKKVSKLKATILNERQENAANNTPQGNKSDEQENDATASGSGYAPNLPTIEQEHSRANEDVQQENDPAKLEVNDQKPAAKAKAKPKPKKEKQQNSLQIRDYVRQMLSEDLDTQVKKMIEELARIQLRLKEKEPYKFKKHKRYVVGIREVDRALKRSKLKMIVIAPNIEKCTSENGLDDLVEDLVECAVEHDVPVVWALSRNRMGKALGKSMRQSMVGILSAEGAHKEFKEIGKMVVKLQEDWVAKQLEAFSTMNIQEDQDGLPEDGLENSADGQVDDNVSGQEEK